jgi:tetratricopeptide (TPR) repeat protein
MVLPGPRPSALRALAIFGLSIMSLLACGAGPLATSVEGGRPWHRVSSPHFVLSTNLGSSEARQVVEDLERVYWVLDRVAFPHARDLEFVSEVAVFAGIDDLAPLGHRATAGLYSFDGLALSDTAPLMILPEQTLGRRASRELFQHELCHRFIHLRYPSAPAWLNEGLAEYFSTVELRSGWVTFGHYLSRKSITNVWGWGLSDGDVYALVPREELPTFEELRALSYAKFYGEFTDPESDDAVKHRLLNYTAAWASVHALLTLPGGRERFANYLARVHEGRTSEAEAFQAAFGSFGTAGLHSAFERFTNAHDTELVRQELLSQPSKVEVRTTELSAAQAKLVIARSSATKTAEQKAHVRRLLDRAVELDPREPEALRDRGYARLESDDLPGALSDLESAHRLDPASPRYMHSLILALMSARAAGENTPALRARLLTLSEQLYRVAVTSAQLNLVSRIQLLVGENAGAARQLAQRALRKDPTCYRCFETLALAAEQRGDWERAHAYQDRAVNLLPHDVSDPQLVERLRRYASAAEQERAAASSAPQNAGDAPSEPVQAVPDQRGD